MKCQECGEEFSSLGCHWRWEPEHRPDISEHQHEIITGLVMGDATVERKGNPNICISMTNRKFLEHIQSVFGNLALNINITRTAEESAKCSRDSGLSPDASEEDYSDIYRLRTVAHPELKRYSNWYNSGPKVWPKDIQFTPTVAAHYYCCDGSLDTNPVNRAHFSVVNESENENKIQSLFSQAGLNVAIGKNERLSGEYKGRNRAYVRLNKEQTQQFFSYVGEPIEGFEYKWPTTTNY